MSNAHSHQDHVFELYSMLNQWECHVNEQQTAIRALYSAWLLGSWGVIVFVLTGQQGSIAISTACIILAVAALGFMGSLLFWALDLLRLQPAMTHINLAEIDLEYQYPDLLPPIRSQASAYYEGKELGMVCYVYIAGTSLFAAVICAILLFLVMDIAYAGLWQTVICVIVASTNVLLIRALLRASSSYFSSEQELWGESKIQKTYVREDAENHAVVTKLMAQMAVEKEQRDKRKFEAQKREADEKTKKFRPK